ncbi:ATP-binding protein [Actinokineospora enzanensis]|uniref:ATP-binding protein n=1 Tax=Actinokineospora enzanensis TaxID=155975 RepID=UPI000368C99F|nr:tetratricopeptide repeat protein [Actinokineospora enzanensis]
MADPDVPRQLLGDVRGFVNRSSEMERLDRVLLGVEPTGLTVIVGTAGVGKTALAMRWAHRVADRFPEGQLYVNLRGYDPGPPVTAEQALDRFLRALAVPAARVPDDVEGKAALYRSLLAGRRVLVVLDNAAHVSQVRPLLPGGTTCRVIATSRDRLEGLMAHDGAQRVTVEILPEDEAVELIRSLTTDYRPGDVPGDLTELARLCACLPLALRIAAERAASRPWMPLAELIRNLRDESGLWDALSAGNGEEHDGVQAVFAWSYRAFSADAARMFRLLGLHPGPEFGVRAAAAGAGVPVADARHLLDSIVSAHMLEQTGPDRYQFHDLLRAYATDAAHHEEPLEQQYEALARILAWYLHTAHAAGTAMNVWGRVLAPTALPAPDTALRFHDRAAAVQWFDLEWSNLFAAIRAADKAGLDKVTWQSVLAAEPGFRRKGVPIANQRVVTATALDAARRDDARQAEGELLGVLGEIERITGHLDESTARYQEALAIFRAIGDHHGERITLNSLGVTLLDERRFHQAAEQFERLRHLQRTAADTEGEAAALFNLAGAYVGMWRHDDAITAANQSIELGRAAANRHLEFVALASLAVARAGNGEVEVALADGARAIQIARELDEPRNEGWALLDYGRIQCLAGRPEDALESYRRALTIHDELGIAERLASTLDGTGNAYRELGRASDAVPFHRQAVSVAREERSEWLLAVALDNLARSLAAAEEHTEATGFRQEAASLLARFDDPEAVARLEQITRGLS